MVAIVCYETQINVDYGYNKMTIKERNDVKLIGIAVYVFMSIV